MQVFKAYFKILFKELIIPISIYIVIFAAISLMATHSNQGIEDGNFNSKKCKVTIIDNDNSYLSKQLAEFISDNSILVEIDNSDTSNIKDMLFYRKVVYVCTIPKNFEQNLLNNQKSNIETMKLPDSTSGILLDTLVNKYLNNVNLYLNNTDLNLEEAIEKTKSTMKISTNVSLKNKEKKDLPQYIYYYNYYAFIIISLLILIISQLSVVFNDIEIKRRNYCSPLSITNYTSQLLISHVVITICVYIVFFMFAVFLYKDSIFTTAGQFVILNSIIFTVVSLCLSFMISNFATKNSVSAISNTLGLGCSFLGGVFVPQSMLSDTVLKIASFNPTYWYVKANNTLSSLSNFNAETLKPVYMSLFIQICFAVVFLAISLVIIKQKRTSEN
ncbi:ABC transporter permease [Sedimentibacter sp. zth1]|uniref:ABC transporter permease n=1 Tax=Sedimentibacter sp. zth1 TaxID=2816908 RepID=UPI001A9239C2|nr:ABC transporter permease [Sedimentibacter sp. zth1]QSX05212.1 ABC transporter permease [Sedimentibacter sp. zth1]